jgi:5-(carboxyamino)imidazole ribonucleotide mutase
MTTIRIVLGSDSDFDLMQETVTTLKEFGVAHEVRVLSAHRTPHELAAYVAKADKEGAKVYIAAAGGAAHLGGVIASLTTRPVLAVPIPSALNGLDSLLSMVQMPGGVPVATFAIGKAGAKNAALFAVQVLAVSDAALAQKLAAHRERMAKQVLEKDAALQKRLQ